MANEISIGELLNQARQQLVEKGLSSPDLDARLLFQKASGFDHVRVISEAKTLVPLNVQKAFCDMLERRLSGEPVQRIIGKWEFFGRAFELSLDTLVPRPETELLVECVLSELGENSKPVRILDVGTGSGIIAVTLACELPEANILASDISGPALETAAKNALSLDAYGQIRFVQSDLFSKIDGQFDIIVSNPPYIPSGEISALQTEVRLFDPLIALDGGSDGLDFYRAIIGRCEKFLNPQGLLLLEVGQGQAADVAQLAQASNFEPIRIVKDLSGIDRVVIVRN